MNYKKISGQFFVIVFAAYVAAAQSPAPPPQMGGPGHERLERFKKMRLIEILNLKEDEAVRFFAKQNAHQDKVRELMKSRNEALDAIDAKVKDKPDAKEIQKLSASVRDIDEKVFAERKRFQDEIQNFLTPEQFGKFLVFERNFEHHMREAMEDIMQRRHRDRNE